MGTNSKGSMKTIRKIYNFIKRLHFHKYLYFKGLSSDKGVLLKCEKCNKTKWLKG